jgi:excinuclease UvrABC ATPase subunit
MNDLLLQLRDKGNTVLVVEHKPEAIEIADHVVDLGPGRRDTAGGEVCLRGDGRGLRASDTSPAGTSTTGPRLKERCARPPAPRGPRRRDPQPARDVDVDIPLGVLVVVTGVAGSGKSSLIHGSVPGATAWCHRPGAIKGSRRSNPATYTGLLEPIRKAFAKANGVKPALFSANSEGACPNCNGAGVIYTDLAMMAGVATTCEECEGKRFQAEVLEYSSAARTSRGARRCRSPRPRSSSPRARPRSRPPHAILTRLADVGLGYLSGSASRSPRCPAASGSASSSPPTWARRAASTSSTSRPPGLHLADVEQLLGLLDRLVDAASRSSSSSTTRP